MASSGALLVHEGREALAAADWDRARVCFEEARELEGAAEDRASATASGPTVLVGCVHGPTDGAKSF
jgi:hypothetical protein